jgi:hypothetical protein
VYVREAHRATSHPQQPEAFMPPLSSALRGTPTSVVVALAAALVLLPVAPNHLVAQATPGDPAGGHDLSSVDATVEALYASITGPAGAPRDWDLFRHLMHPTAGRLISVDENPEGEAVHRVMTPDEFVSVADAGMVAQGFFERELGFTQERFGNVVHRFSAYDSKRAFEDPEPYSRGINSIQLLWHEGRWWVVTILWDRERPDNLIPAALGG